MAPLQLNDDTLTFDMGSHMRYYVLFTSQYIPLWTPLIRLGIKLYGGTYPVYTHTLLAVQDVERSVMTFYEMSFNEGMDTYSVQFRSTFYIEGTLCMHHVLFNGEHHEEEYAALDITRHIHDNQLDVSELFYGAYTDKKLTPYTLSLHLTPLKDKVTWTCTGLTQVLIGCHKYESFARPLTPDQLYDTVLAISRK